MLDANENATSDELTATMRTLGLIEAITTKHDATGTVPTYNR